MWEVTSPRLAILRLHGRNHWTWMKGLASLADCFNFDHGEPQRSPFVAPVRALAQRTRTVHMISNNYFEDQGQRNAATMLRLFDADVPPTG